MRKLILFGLGATLFTFLGACGGSQRAPAGPAAAEPAAVAPAEPSAIESTGAKEGMSCPFASPDTVVAVEDVDGGVALTITGSEDRVAFLRQWGAKRAAMASGNAMRPMGPGGDGKGMHGKGMHGKGMHGKGMHGGPAENRPGGMMMPPANAMTEDVPGGVKLILKAKDAQDVAKLREHVHQHASMMREGRCPMMHASSDGADSPCMEAEQDVDLDPQAHHPDE